MEGTVLGIVNDLTKTSKMSADDVNKHTRRLQDAAGLLSGTVQELSNRSLQELASSAAKPAEFLEKYRDASEKDTPNLVPMMEILHGVCADDVTRAHFSQSTRRTGSSIGGSSSIAAGGSSQAAPSLSNFQALKEKLLQQVGPRAVLDSSNADSGSRLYPERTHLTLDFQEEEHLMRTHVGELGKIPVVSQESAIISDLLYCLIGIEGTHLKPLVERPPGAAVSTVTFPLDPTLDPSLRELLSRITPICQHYSVVVSFAEENMLSQAGRVNQAFAGALYELLKDYFVFVAQLEAEHKKGDLTLNKIWFYIQPTLQTLSAVSEVCRSARSLGGRGGSTLSLLHKAVTGQAGAGGDARKAVMEFLARTAARPYFETLSRWVHRGIIHDPGKDFFVEDNEIIEKSALPLEYSDDYWERRYSIKAEQIPTFLRNYADMVLRTGKYLNVIQQCDKEISWPDDVEDIVYLTNPEHYVLPLEKAYAFASKTLLDLLVKDRDLIGHLRSVKHYFLLDQGDFIAQFLDLCESELAQNVNCVEPARLESLLELAQRTSGANTDPYKDNVCVELLPYDLIFQMCKILSIDTDCESEFRTPANTADLTGLEAFAFGYDVQWPVSLVLNRKSLACYQMLLRHLFYCKHIERIICNAWSATKFTKLYRGNVLVKFSASFALRQKMLNFLQNLEYYMTFEVLEPNWEALIAKIRSGKVENVDQVLEIHSDFLSTCLNDCMLSNPSLLTTVKKLLGICGDFSNFLVRFTQETGSGSSDQPSDAELEMFHQEVAKYNLQFSSVLLSLLDRISQLGRENYNERILNILNRLDFNGFYTKELEQFGCSS